MNERVIRTRVFTTADADPEEDRGPCGCHGSRSKRPWPQERRGPMPVLRRHHQVGPYQLWRRWVDHHYVERVDGVTRYIAEPYEIGDEAFEDFAVLRDAGFDILISASAARHYPGHTIAVVITEPEREP